MAVKRAKGLVIAGGQLAPVANKPLVLYGIDAMRSAGIREVGIVADEAVAEAIRTLLGDELGGGMRVRYLRRPPGATAGGCLAEAADFLGESPCVAQLRDGLVRGDVRPLVEEFVRDDLDALLLLEPGGRLAGLHVLGPRVVDEASSGGGLEELLDRVLAAGGRARKRPFDGAWKQVERADELLEANRLVLDDLHAGPWRGELIDSRVEGRVSIGPGAVLESTVVRGPAVIGSGVRLRHAYIGPYTSIGDEVEIEGAEIEHSIVLPGAVIKHLGGRLEASIVGRGAKLFRDFGLPRAMRVRLADGDEIALG